MDMLLTFPVNSSTRSSDRREPTKDAITVTDTGIWLKSPVIMIVVMARNSFAPEDIPSTKGPAIGFRKKVWIRNPESDKAPPSREARTIRGRRIFHMML